jgi:Tfp pilus assembly protein PilX
MSKPLPSIQTRPYPARQQGMTLVVGLIMLVLITLATVASYNIGKTSLGIVGNMQNRNEATTAANNTIQEALSTTRLFTNPDDILGNACGGVANRRCVDVNGDGVNDITVDLTPTPTCVQARTILNAELRPELESGVTAVSQNAANCMQGTTQGIFGIEGVPTGNSICANSVWEIVAVSTDAVTGSTVTVTEGAAVRVSTATIDTYCP